MNSTLSANFKKILPAFYSVMIAILIVVNTPALAKADSRSNSPDTPLTQEWRSAVGSSMAVVKYVLSGNFAESARAEHSNEVILRIEEAKMISFINQERAKAGLGKLAVDYSLVQLAEEKSQDMVSFNYFGHISDRFGTVYDQLERNRLSYNIVAENLAGAKDVQKAQQYFMESPPHRRNILNPRFTRVGVGIIRGGPFGAMITQIFLG